MIRVNRSVISVYSLTPKMAKGEFTLTVIIGVLTNIMSVVGIVMFNSTSLRSMATTSWSSSRSCTSRSHVSARGRSWTLSSLLLSRLPSWSSSCFVSRLVLLATSGYQLSTGWRVSTSADSGTSECRPPVSLVPCLLTLSPSCHTPRNWDGGMSTHTHTHTHT